MNYGLYLSASGVLTNLYRQDVFANNLANVNTVSFKPDLPSIRQRDPESIEDNFGSDVSKRLLDRLGGGVLAGPQQIQFKPGPLQKTGSPLDVALEKANTFFAVQGTDPDSGEATVHLTRDGRFSRDNEGFLVTTAGGHRVLNQNDQPIFISGDSPVQIDNTGRILQAGDDVGQLQVTAVSDPTRLVKQGESLYRFKGGEDIRQPVRTPSVRSGFVEASGVDPIQALMKLIGATKSATGNGNLIRYHDLLMDRAVNVLGRVG